jgi:CubicO group peptidase (beta-lactamase class C family)
MSANSVSRNSLGDLLIEANAPYGFPALAACVASSSEVLASGVVGSAVYGRSATVTPDSRFHIGSITKSLTATAIATMVESGDLEWTTRPLDVFPELGREVHPALREVQLRHLLSHRAGIAPFTEDEELAAVGPFAGSPRDQRAAFTEYLLRQAPVVTPVEEYLYSNAGYAIAAAMAERITDAPWETFMAERYLRPAGLDSAGVGWPAASHPGEPWGHRKRGADFVPHPPDDAYQLGPLFAPAGDLHMSVVDLARHGQMHVRGLRGADTVVRADTMRTLHTPFGEYSLGWNEHESGPQHSGSAETFFAFLVLDPERDRVCAFATNAYDGEAGEDSPAYIALATSVLRAMRAADE